MKLQLNIAIKFYRGIKQKNLYYKMKGIQIMKKNVLKRLSAFLLCCTMIIGCMTGCGKETNESVESQSTVNSVVSNSTSESTPVVEPEEPVKLTIWSSFTCEGQVDNPGDTAFYQEIEKACNVEFEFIDSTGGAETLSILIGTNMLPDLVYCRGKEISGGIQSLLEAGTIVSMNELMDQGWLPNFSTMLENDPELAKMAQNSNGQYAWAASYIAPGAGDFTEGYMIRQDWLDELGLKAPETIAEMEEVLLAFKEKYGALGLAFSWKSLVKSSLVTAWGVADDFYLDGDVVKYGPYEDAYKEFLTLANRWIDLGIMDPDTFTQDNNTFWSKMASGKYGLVYGYRGGDFGKVVTFEDEAARNWVPIAFPVLVEGEEYPFNYSIASRYSESMGFFVPEKCENKEAAARVIDYMFSEEGTNLQLWGIEGESYEVVNGEKVYTEKVKNNPDGLSFTNALSFYAGGVTESAGYHPRWYFERTLAYDTQVLANELWRLETSDNRKLPTTTKTDEEAEEYNMLITDINTYVSEFRTNVILGNTSLDKFEDFQKSLKEMGIERCIELQQAAYDRSQK